MKELCPTSFAAIVLEPLFDWAILGGALMPRIFFSEAGRRGWPVRLGCFVCSAANSCCLMIAVDGKEWSQTGHDGALRDAAPVGVRIPSLTANSTVCHGASMTWYPSEALAAGTSETE